MCIACLMVREEMLVNQQKEKRGRDVNNDNGKDEGVEEHGIRLGIGEKRGKTGRLYVRDRSKEHQEYMDGKNEQRKQKRKGKSKESRE